MKKRILVFCVISLYFIFSQFIFLENTCYENNTICSNLYQTGIVSNQELITISDDEYIHHQIFEEGQ